MKNPGLLITLLSLAFAAQSVAQYNHDNLKIRQASVYASTDGNPDYFDLQFTYENLRLYPIVANDVFLKEHEELGKFTLLKDAIDDDKIIITETGASDLADGDVNQSDRGNDRARGQSRYNINSNAGMGVSGTVNTLFAKNNSTDTIFIMAGEVVKGGKQDRVIAEDLVIVPGENIDLAAFCVEKSRWTTKDNNMGKFTGYYNVSSMDIRQAVTEDKNQSKVWSKVDEHTMKNQASSETEAYTNLENSEEYQQKVEAYLSKFQSAFDNDNSVIGVIAVSGDEVLGLDMFATNDLFADSYENLIHSYIGHAITNGSKVTISNDDVFAYLDSILKTEEKQDEEIEKNGTVYKYKKKKLHIAKY